MTFADRVLRSAFVALAVGLGWGIRGDFGHMIGAMYPGACLALGLAYVSRQKALFLWMPILAAVSAIGIGSGGSMSYGILHGYSQSDTFINYGYGFLTLFLQGAAWGVFGGAMIGIVLERQPLQTVDWLSLVGSVMAGGWFTSLLVVTWWGVDINPPRNNSSITFFGAALALLIWLAANRRWLGFRGALLGYLGFGLGMSGGRLLGNVANVLQTTSLDFSINHWNVMEVSCGLIGGFIFSMGMLGRSFPPPPERENVRWTSLLSMVFVLGVIPLWHRLARIDPSEKLTSWTNQLQAYGYDQPGQLAESILWWVDAVCVLGFVGAALWMVIYYRRWHSLAWMPVMWLSLTMLLFQNLTAFYFFYPRVPRQLNMHHLFWVLFVLMAFYVLVTSYFRPQPLLESSEPSSEPSPENAKSLQHYAEERVPFVRWIASALVAFALIVLAAGFVNGPETMRSGNTRWPVWSWSEGPFPGTK